MSKKWGYRHGSSLLSSGLANCGRIAGSGISHDNYGDESGNPDWNGFIDRVRMPSDGEKPESLNGEVIIIQEGKKENNNG